MDSPDYNGEGRGKRIIGLILGLLVIMAVATALYLFIQGGKKPTPMPLLYEISLTKKSYASGEGIGVVSAYDFRGNEKVRHIKVVYRLINATQDILHEEVFERDVLPGYRETVLLNATKAIPPGKYYVYSEAQYDKARSAVARTMYFDYISGIVSGSVSSNASSSLANNASDNLQPIESRKSENVAIKAQIAIAKSFVRGDNPDNAQAASTCLNISSVKIGDSCLTGLAREAKNYAFCNEERETYSKDYCYLSYVIETKDYEKCSLIESPRSRDSCNLLSTALNNG